MRLAETGNVLGQKRGLLIGAAFAEFLAAMVILWAMARVDDVPSYSLAMVLLALTTVPFAVALARGRFDLLEPIYILSFIIALYFAGRAIYLEMNPSASGLGYYPYRDMIPLALGYTILGYLSFLAGYYSTIPSKIAGALPRLGWHWPHNLSFGRVLLIYAIGLSAQFLWFRSVGSRTWEIGSGEDSLPSYVWVALSNFVLYAMCMTVIRIFEGGAPRKWRYLFWLALVPTAVAQGLIWGGRYALLAPVAMVLVAYHYLRRRLSLLQVVMPTIVIFTTVFPALALYRGVYLGSVGVAHDLAEFVKNVQGFFGYLSQLEWSEYISFATNAVMGRSHGIDSLSLIIKYTPGLADFKYGWEYLLIPAYAFIPRAFWPDKPVNKAVEFGLLYVVHPLATTVTSISEFHIGDLYRNFALPGIVVGMFVLGIFYRTVYVYLWPIKGKDSLRVFLYTFFILFVIQRFETDIASTASELLKTLVFLTPVLWFMRKRE